MEMGERRAVANLALEKISKAKTLLAQVDDMEKNHIKGASKLRKRIQAEIKFLNKGLKSGSEMKEDHVMCSNLGQLGAVATVAASVPNVTGILQPFTTMNSEKLIVDIVADNGRQWMKVIMRNPKALHLLYISGGRKGTKPLDEVAEDFVMCAEQHPVFYTTPKVVFWFCNGVSEGLATALEDRGVLVHGHRIPDHQFGLPDIIAEDSGSEDFDSEDEESEDGNDSKEDEPKEENHVVDLNQGRTYEEELIGTLSEEKPSNNNLDHRCPLELQESSDLVPHLCKLQIEKSMLTEASSENCRNKNEQVRKINLDITAMIAYVSATANGGANFIFKDKLLTEQAEWERKNPVKETLDSYFKGCELMACQEAVDHFSSIVGTIGGEGEQTRAEQLLARLTIVPGIDYLKDKVRQGGRASDRARLVFGTGHAHRAITVTSNGNFVRSATQQGVKLAVLFHQPRALTEAKESTATPL